MTLFRLGFSCGIAPLWEHESDLNMSSTGSLLSTPLFSLVPLVTHSCTFIAVILEIFPFIAANVEVAILIKESFL